MENIHFVFIYSKNDTLITQSGLNCRRECAPILCENVWLSVQSCLVSLETYLNVLPWDLYKPGVICFPVELNLNVHFTISAEEMVERDYVPQIKCLSSLYNWWQKRVIYFWRPSKGNLSGPVKKYELDQGGSPSEDLERYLLPINYTRNILAFYLEACLSDHKWKCKLGR